MSSYRPALVAQLEALGFDSTRIDNTVKIPNRSLDGMIPSATVFGVGTLVATQLVLRYRFGNI